MLQGKNLLNRLFKNGVMFELVCLHLFLIFSFILIILSDSLNRDNEYISEFPFYIRIFIYISSQLIQTLRSRRR